MSALRSGRLKGMCRPLLVGEPCFWRRAGWDPRLSPLHDTGLGLQAPPYGKPSQEGGRASFAAVGAALRLAARGVVRGVVTAPISKRSWALAGVPYGDHTAFLERETGSAEMILGSPRLGLWCALATRHLPLRRAIAALSRSRILSAAAALDTALRRLGAAKPRLALCALNPHAGEGGLLGSEEAGLLAPAAEAARRKGLDIVGPVPADAAWRGHREGRFEGLVCLYHDQALIALKAAAGLEVVNWTVGPLVRTSPGHGTAFDVAGRGLADPSAVIAATALAARLCRSKREVAWKA